MLNYNKTITNHLMIINIYDLAYVGERRTIQPPRGHRRLHSPQSVHSKLCYTVVLSSRIRENRKV